MKQLLSYIPEYILESILDYLLPNELLQCCLVSKAINERSVVITEHILGLLAKKYCTIHSLLSAGSKKSPLNILHDISNPILLFIGGGADGHRVDLLKTHNGTSTQGQNMIINHGSFYTECTADINGYVYCLSGENLESSGTIEKYNVLGNTVSFI